jgi:DNA-directed RNA polymerase sigma subunit (sigma70/sigma32)
MNLEQQIKDNQDKIRQLAASFEIWLNTKHAKSPAVRAEMQNLQEHMMHRLQELEIEGQGVKIASMEKGVALLRDGVAAPAL